MAWGYTRFPYVSPLVYDRRREAILSATLWPPRKKDTEGPNMATLM